MNVVLWIAAVLLAIAFLLTGMYKLSRPKEKIREQMAWVDDFSANAVRSIGALEVLGAIGLILPGITKIAPVLVPLAATGLAIIMVGAAIVHLRRGERQPLGANIVLFALAVFVAWGRFGPYAFS